MLKFIIWVLTGALAGFLAGKIMDSGDKGFLMNAIIGIVGGALGGFLGNLLGFGGGGWISGLILSVVGACLLIFIYRKLIAK